MVKLLWSCYLRKKRGHFACKNSPHSTKKCYESTERIYGGIAQCNYSLTCGQKDAVRCAVYLSVCHGLLGRGASLQSSMGSRCLPTIVNLQRSSKQADTTYEKEIILYEASRVDSAHFCALIHLNRNGLATTQWNCYSSQLTKLTQTRLPLESNSHFLSYPELALHNCRNW